MIRVFTLVRNTTTQAHECLVLIRCILDFSPEEHRVIQTVDAVVGRDGLDTDFDQLL